MRAGPEGPSPWPAGLLPLVECGCNIRECVDCLRPPHAVLRDDPNRYPPDRPVEEWFTPVADSLEQRFEHWLAAEPARGAGG